MTRNALKSAQLAAFNARRDARDAVAALSTPQRDAFNAGIRAGEIVAAALDMVSMADDLTAAAKAAKVAHRAA